MTGRRSGGARAPAALPALALALCAAAAAPADALEIVNDHAEPAKIVIERWVQFVSAGGRARFRPYESPTLIKIELRHLRLSCEAGAEAEVRLTEYNCYVDGELAGEGQFRM